MPRYPVKVGLKGIQIENTNLHRACPPPSSISVRGS